MYAVLHAMAGAALACCWPQRLGPASPSSQRPSACRLEQESKLASGQAASSLKRSTACNPVRTPWRTPGTLARLRSKPHITPCVKSCRRTSMAKPNSTAMSLFSITAPVGLKYQTAFAGPCPQGHLVQAHNVQFHNQQQNGCNQQDPPPLSALAAMAGLACLGLNSV